MLPAIAGPTHRYMRSSPACWERYGLILAREYEDSRLLATHRLSVDAYAAQHPGAGTRQAIQSVGLHLARLMVMLEHPQTMAEANGVMLDFGASKASLPLLEPAPRRFDVTVGDIPIEGAWEDHARAVRKWADATWDAWAGHHDTIRNWVAVHSRT